jgi:FKBP-type peptidyl-prolyl cis-trans isomerase
MIKHKIIKISTLALLASLVTSSPAYSDETTTASGASVAMKSDQQKLSYTIGVKAAQELKLYDLDTAAYLAGYKDMATDTKLQLADKEMEAAIMQFQKSVKAKYDEQMKKMQEAAKGNLSTGAKYLENNKTQAGVLVTPSGLQYKIITAGTGAKPTLGQSVTVNYKGSTIDGKEFDNSYKRNRSETFKLEKGGLIEGWVEALQMMPVGSTWHIVIPSSLGYGDKGSPPVIEPNAVLVFDIELVSVKK